MKGEGNPNYNRVITNCGYCQKEINEIPYKVNNQKHIYCSDECYREHRRILMTGDLNPNYVRVTLDCEVCGKVFPRKPGAAKRSIKKYCSRRCYEWALAEYNLNRKAGEMYPCSICGKPIYATKTKRQSRKYFYCSTECKDMGWSLYFSGSNNPKWREDKPHEERIKERLLEGYKKWRTSVYERDLYTCKCCGDGKGGNLVAHHKNGWDKFSDRRLDVDNGITLCKTCHKEFHSIYSYGGNTEEQFNTWLLNRN
ncbi:HNH endonuclease [Bacillus sp. ISL-46]|nr:HNH endonuclease [Bacillus sp. ISL-46]